jgi:hypothetical protein
VQEFNGWRLHNTDLQAEIASESREAMRLVCNSKRFVMMVYDDDDDDDDDEMRRRRIMMRRRTTMTTMMMTMTTTMTFYKALNTFLL